MIWSLLNFQSKLHVVQIKRQTIDKLPDTWIYTVHKTASRRSFCICLAFNTLKSVCKTIWIWSQAGKGRNEGKWTSAQHFPSPEADQSSLSAWRRFIFLVTPRMSCEDSDQTARMRRLIRVFALRKHNIVGSSVTRLKCRWHSGSETDII